MLHVFTVLLTELWFALHLSGYEFIISFIENITSAECNAQLSNQAV